MTAVSNCASINTFTDETWLCGRLAGCVTLSPAHNDDEDDDDDTEDADGDGGPVREHQRGGVKHAAYFNRRPESILKTL